MTARKPAARKPQVRAPAASQGQPGIVHAGPTPLFVRFANGDISEAQLGKSFAASTDAGTKAAAEAFLADPRDLSEFRSDFAACLKDLLENGPVAPVTSYLDSYMSVSLDEVEEHAGKGSWGTSSRQAVVKDPEAPWPEAMVCYNLCVYLKGFGNKDLKACKQCGRFFTHKGPHAS